MISIKETDFFLEIDDVLRSKIEQALHNFDQLQKDRKYQLSFSGGKDSHALLAIYSLYLKIGGQPLDLVVSFSDTHLENASLYLAIERAEEYCESIGIPFVFAESEKSYWWFQFGIGYAVPDYRVRWCTRELKIDPLKKLKRIPITGRHFGESSARDERLLKTCGSSECGTDKITNGVDPIIDFTNCNVWDLLFFADGNCIYDGCFTLLQSNYKKAEDIQTGSLRMGCVVCPVAGQGSMFKKYLDGIIPKFAYDIRLILDDLRNARRLKSPRTKKNGALYIHDRRHYWTAIMAFRSLLLEHGWITLDDIKSVETALAEGRYPKTYSAEWIAAEHDRIEQEQSNRERNPFYDLHLFKHL